MHFFVIGFHSVGKDYIQFFFTIFYHMVPFFQVWSIKQYWLYSCFLLHNYRVKWINNADVIVRVCVRMLVYA